MILIVINYIVSGIFITLGIVLVSGIVTLDEVFGEGNTVIFGVVMLLYGAFRAVMNYTKHQQYLKWRDEDD